MSFLRILILILIAILILLGLEFFLDGEVLEGIGCTPQPFKAAQR